MGGDDCAAAIRPTRYCDLGAGCSSRQPAMRRNSRPLQSRAASLPFRVSCATGDISVAGWGWFQEQVVGLIPNNNKLAAVLVLLKARLNNIICAFLCTGGRTGTIVISKRALSRLHHTSLARIPIEQWLVSLCANERSALTHELTCDLTGVQSSPDREPAWQASLERAASPPSFPSELGLLGSKPVFAKRR